MHETKIAESVPPAIQAEADNYKAKPIGATISCGTLNALNEELLAFAFEAIAAESTCRDIKLNVQVKPMQGKCNKCEKLFDFEIVKPNCSHCGSDDFELLPDAPLVLESIEFQTE